MRLTGGDFGGRVLATSKSADFRPTMDRVREAVFNILASAGRVENAIVCDLFAGSGSYGFEALSRGAGSVTFVERNPALVRILQGNIQTLDVAPRASVIPLRVESFCDRPSGPYTLIFADPPYAYTGTAGILERLVTMVAHGGRILWEHDVRGTLPDIPGLSIVDQRRYGTSAITMYDRDHDGAEA